jgi:putative transposase
VTMRVIEGLGSLRAQKVSGSVGKAIRAGKERTGFRIVHFSIQSNHLHFIVEASGTQELAAGIKGLAVRIAHAVNKALGRKGKVFPHRYHARALRTPREVRNAIRYVLANFKHQCAAEAA